MKHLIILLLGCGCSSLLWAQEGPIRINLQELKPELDGLLSDSVWQTAHSFPFTEFNPNWGQHDSLTQMYLSFDTRHLYVAIQAHEPQPEAIVGRSLIRDRWYGDDYLSFHIDPNRSRKRSFIFSVFPEGAKTDIAVSNDAIPLGNATFNDAYDMIWRAQTRLTDSGWVAEMAIPLSNLRLKQAADGTVRAGISGLRSQNYLNKRSTWPRLSRAATNAIESPSLKQEIIFEGMPTRRQLQIAPYLLGGINRNRTSSLNRSIQREIGLDLRIGISPHLTLDLSYNTDFAQVEIDDQVVNIGNRVNIFLPEKRRFFQEQAGLFDFSLGFLSQLFYSRTIGVSDGQLTPILGGGRLTGEIAGIEVGAMTMRTQALWDGDSLQQAQEQFSVLRLRKKVFNERSFMGFMATHRQRAGYFNTALGMDALLHLPGQHVLIGSVSSTLETESISTYNWLDHTRASLILSKRKETGLSYHAAYEYSAKQYNPAMGFLLRGQHHNLYTALNYGVFRNTREEGLFSYQRWGWVNSDLYLKPDLSAVITWYNRSSWRGTFFSGDQIAVFGQAQYEFLESPIQYAENLIAEAGTYFFPFAGLSYSPAVQRNIQATLSAEYGGFFAGTRFKMAFSPEINFNKHLNVNLSWETNHIRFPSARNWLHILNAKFNWAANIHLSGGAIAQYNAISQRLFFSGRIRYNFRDGHDIYLAFNQAHEEAPNLSGRLLSPFENQSLAIKYIYTFMR